MAEVLSKVSYDDTRLCTSVHTNSDENFTIPVDANAEIFLYYLMEFKAPLIQCEKNI